jgi:hypothetical protein
MNFIESHGKYFGKSTVLTNSATSTHTHDLSIATKATEVFNTNALEARVWGHITRAIVIIVLLTSKKSWLCNYLH